MVTIHISVDWEGLHLKHENLKAMKKFRTAFPQAKIWHFLNPVYFVRPNAATETIKKEIQSVILPTDVLGLHVHAWKNLVEASGVQYQHGPTLGSDIMQSNTFPDIGYDVPLTVYSVDEIRQILKFSRNVLVSHGLGTPVSFRAGYWQAGSAAFEALAAEGFQIDSSAVPAQLLKHRSVVYNSLLTLWPKIEITSQPYPIPTSNGRILEIPNLGGMADHVDEVQMVEIFRANLSCQSNPYVQFGFHQETAATSLPRLGDGLRRIMELADQEKITLNWDVNFQWPLLPCPSS